MIDLEAIKNSLIKCGITYQISNGIYEGKPYTIIWMPSYEYALKNDMEKAMVINLTNNFIRYFHYYNEASPKTHFTSTPEAISLTLRFWLED